MLQSVKQPSAQTGTLAHSLITVAYQVDIYIATAHAQYLINVVGSFEVELTKLKYQCT